MKGELLGLTKGNFYGDKKPVEKKVEYTIETSWDDCHILDLKIPPLLTKYKMKGVFYIVVDRIGTENHLTWDQVKELEKQGFEIGSHTMSHPADLKELYDEQLHYEVQNSKDLIESVLGHTISKFCYPRGRYNDRVEEFVLKAGYVFARTTGKPGVTTFDRRTRMPGTIHVANRPEYGDTPVLDFAKQTIDRVKKEGGYINIWGHSKEIEGQNHWGTLEEILKYVTA